MPFCVLYNKSQIFLAKVANLDCCCLKVFVGASRRFKLRLVSRPVYVCAHVCTNKFKVS